MKISHSNSLSSDSVAQVQEVDDLPNDFFTQLYNYNKDKKSSDPSSIDDVDIKPVTLFLYQKS